MPYRRELLVAAISSLAAAVILYAGERSAPQPGHQTVKRAKVKDLKMALGSKAECTKRQANVLVKLPPSISQVHSDLIIGGYGKQPGCNYALFDIEVPYKPKGKGAHPVVLGGYPATLPTLSGKQCDSLVVDQLLFAMAAGKGGRGRTKPQFKLLAENHFRGKRTGKKCALLPTPWEVLRVFSLDTPPAIGRTITPAKGGGKYRIAVRARVGSQWQSVQASVRWK